MSTSARPSAISVLSQSLRSCSSSSQAVGVEPGRGAGVPEEEERAEAHDLGLGREQPQEQAGEPDRFGAERRPRAVLGHVGGVALVVEEVDHRRDHPQPLAALDGPGVSKGTCAAATARLARLMRPSIAASETRKARAIRATERPETILSASAICWVSGWQQMKRSRRTSSR